MLSGREFDDSFPSMMMAYYTEKARKKQARKRRGPDTHSKGVFSRMFSIFKSKKNLPIQQSPTV